MREMFAKDSQVIGVFCGRIVTFIERRGIRGKEDIFYFCLDFFVNIKMDPSLRLGASDI